MSIAKLDAARERELRGVLYGRKRTYHTIVAEIESGASALAVTVKGWGAFAPKPAALDEAERVAIGLQRLVVELRAFDIGGPPDAAA